MGIKEVSGFSLLSNSVSTRARFLSTSPLPSVYHMASVDIASPLFKSDAL